MRLLLRQLSVVDPRSAHHQDQVDILVEDGTIREIGANLDVLADQTYDLNGAYATPGWMDVGILAGDPGYEQREDLTSLSRAAANGGFTTAVLLPNTNPVVDHKAGVRYYRQFAENNLVDIYPLAAVSERTEGRDITEMMDLHQAGALAFTDGMGGIQDGGLLLRALQYVKAFDGVVFNYPTDRSVALEGQMHEGRVSTMLGMKGIPALAEELMIMRDLELLAYSESRLHLANLSTAGGVTLVRRAKERGLQVTSSVSALHMVYTEAALENYNSFFKVYPPLRSEGDRQALLAGLQDGTIDFVSSGHVPLEEEAKKLEFPYAVFGAAGIETAFAMLWTALQDFFSLEQWLDLWAFGPRRVLGLTVPVIGKGAPAELTIFHPEDSWMVEPSTLYSKGVNYPVVGTKYRGRAVGIVRGRQSVFLRNQ